MPHNIINHATYSICHATYYMSCNILHIITNHATYNICHATFVICLATYTCHGTYIYVYKNHSFDTFGVR